MEGMTITEMAKKLKIPPRTVERRIQRAGIRPLTKEAIYPPDTLDKIKEVKMGRPPKKPEAQDQAVKKGKK
jgi:predicted ArsR family transcriptional regulator